MTFLLTKDTADGYIVGPSRAITGYSGGIGASFQKAALENNANFRLQRETTARRDEVARTAARALGQDTMRRLVDEQNAKAKALGLNSKIIEPSNDPAEMAYALGSNGSKAILDLARQEVAKNPSAFRGINFTEEGIDKFVAEKLQAERQDAVDAIEMMPSGRFSAELIGSMAGMTADIKNVPFLLLGGGSGSILKVFAREAMLNVAAETAFIPDQFKMADVLDIPEPDIVSNLLLAAGAGGTLGVGIEVLGRGFRYALTMGRKPTPVGADPMTFEAAVGEAETALMQGDDPLAAADAVLQPRSEPQAAEAVPEAAEVAPAAREPLVPDPVASSGVPDDAALAQEALDALRSTDARVKRPLSDWIKSSPKRGEDLRIDPAGPLGQELKARGVNSRTYPGLFKKGGRGDLDNLVASEMEETFPGISSAAGVDADYLDARGLAEVLIRDAQGDASWLNSRADLLAAEKAAFDAENPNRVVSAAQAYSAMERADDGLFIDLNLYEDLYEFDGGDVQGAIGRAFDDYVARKGISGLTPQEVFEIKDQLARQGGDAHYLIERAFERTIDEGDYEATGRSAASGADGEGGQDIGSTFDIPADAPKGGTGQSGGSLASERTAAGEQTLIPGVAPVAPSLTRPAPVRGPQEADSQIGGMFDLANLSMRDMFDSPLSPKALEANNARVVELRQTVEADGNFPLGETGEDGRWRGMTADDGRQLKTLADALNEIDEMDALAREIELCRIGKATPNDAG